MSAAMLHRRKILAATAALLPLSLASRARPAWADATPVPLSAADRADLAKVEHYLNGLTSLKAHFMQVTQAGDLSQGTAWLERPGRMRFQYDPPAPFLLLASHGVLVFHDSQLQQTSNIPLSRTPLGILLSAHITLSGDITVTGVQREPGQIQVTLVRTASPGDGSLTLIFSHPPMALRQWTVVDAQRRVTHVTLYNVETGGRFDQNLFEHINPDFGPN